MTEAGIRGAPAANAPEEFDPYVLIDGLRARGAERFDPVGFRFIEALARRRAAHAVEARATLDRRLAAALSEYAERFDRAEREAGHALARGTARFPGASDTLRQHFQAADFRQLYRSLVRLEAPGGAESPRGPLAGLLAHIARPTPEGATGLPAPATGAKAAPPGELKSLSYFRNTWSKLSLDRQLSHAFAQAPENAGPLNSHFLVLQSLRLMRDISPEYLERFISYVDALLWLDHAEGGRSPAHKNVVRGEREKKRKSGRSRAG